MENWRFANLASAVVNAVRLSVPRTKNSPRPRLTQPSDFYPVLKHDPAKVTALTDEQKAFIEKRKKHGKRRRRNR